MNEKNEPKSVMGWVFGMAAVLLAFPAATLKGYWDTLDGGSFQQGRDKMLEWVLAHAGKFGDKHGGQIVTRIVSGLVLGVSIDWFGISKGHDQ